MISDVKHREDTNGDGIVDQYTANVISVDDSYPFGWSLKERSFSVDQYRYGFNSKENDESWGDQLIQDYGFRLYNPAIGKFLSVDPLSPDYPWYTPYQFAGNMPIRFIDLDGLEPANPKWYFIKAFQDAFNFDWRKRADSNYSVKKSKQIAKEVIDGTLTNAGQLLFPEPKDPLGALFISPLFFVGPEAAIEEAVVGGLSAVARPVVRTVKKATKPIRDKISKFKIPLPFRDVRTASRTSPSTSSSDEVFEEFIDPSANWSQVRKVTSKYDYGNYGSNFLNHAEDIRRDLGIPDSWTYKRSKKDGGVKFMDPNNPSANHIRVMPGRLQDPNPNSQAPYVVRYKNGGIVDSNGQPIPNRTGQNQNRAPEGHVPIQNFSFD